LILVALISAPREKIFESWPGLNIVIAGLDPAIHVDPQHALHFIMDARAGKLAQPA
jgi:hypothetical protein